MVHQLQQLPKHLSFTLWIKRRKEELTTISSGRISDHCYTISFPNGYSMPTCGYLANMSKTIDTIYGGLPTPIFLPRYLGVDNILTVETQFPDGQRPSSTSGTAEKVSQTGSPNPEWPATKKKSLAGPIAGGVIGGLGLLVAVGTGLWLLFRKRGRNNFMNENRKASGPEVGGLLIAAPYELGGKPRTTYEIG